MMRIGSTVAMLAVMLVLAPMAHAEDAPPPAPNPAVGEMPPGMPGGMHGKWKAMTPEERQARHAEMKEKFDKLPPEKQAEIKQRTEERHARHKEMREKWKAMTPEERQTKRTEMKEKFGKLPPEKQARILEKLERRHERHEDRREDRREGHPGMTPPPPQHGAPAHPAQ